MVDEDARDRAIYQALKALDEVAAALQAHLIEEHQADPDRSSAQSTSTNSLKLLRQARERLGEGLRTIERARSPSLTLILQPASGPAELSIVSGLMCWWFLVPTSGGRAAVMR